MSHGTSFLSAQKALLLVLLIALVGLFFPWKGTSNSAVQAPPVRPVGNIHALSDIVESDLAILWVGNSHTQSHDLPDLVASLIRHLKPDHKIEHRTISVAFLEGEENRINKRISAQSWDHVILQAQKISASGRVRYSTSDGVAVAKHAMSKGSRVHFYSEWGLRGDPNNAAHTASIYREMAQESGANLIGVGDAWTRVLESAPDLELYSPDGNHQSRLGASLTALAIARALLDVSAAEFLEYPDPVASREQWKLFCQAIDAVTASQSPN